MLWQKPVNIGHRAIVRNAYKCRLLDIATDGDLMNKIDNGTATARQTILDNIRFDAGRSARARIGFVLIPNEQTIEADMTRHMPTGVGTYFSRATMPREISTQSLAQLRGSLAETAGRILPDDGLDVICFAGTSGTVAVGEEASRAELAKARPGRRQRHSPGPCARPLPLWVRATSRLGRPMLRN